MTTNFRSIKNPRYSGNQCYSFLKLTIFKLAIFFVCIPQVLLRLCDAISAITLLFFHLTSWNTTVHDICDTGAFITKAGFDSPQAVRIFPELALASACCANRKFHCYPEIMRDVATLHYERYREACSNARVTRSHTWSVRWTPWHPNFFSDDTRLLTCVRKHSSNPLITGKRESCVRRNRRLR